MSADEQLPCPTLFASFPEWTGAELSGRYALEPADRHGDPSSPVWRSIDPSQDAAYIYYDLRHSAWQLGPEPHGARTYARAPSYQINLPPATGWEVPFLGAMWITASPHTGIVPAGACVAKPREDASMWPACDTFGPRWGGCSQLTIKRADGRPRGAPLIPGMRPPPASWDAWTMVTPIDLISSVQWVLLPDSEGFEPAADAPPDATPALKHGRPHYVSAEEVLLPSSGKPATLHLYYMLRFNMWVIGADDCGCNGLFYARAGSRAPVPEAVPMRSWQVKKYDDGPGRELEAGSWVRVPLVLRLDGCCAGAELSAEAKNQTADETDETGAAEAAPMEKAAAAAPPAAGSSAGATPPSEVPAAVAPPAAGSSAGATPPSEVAAAAAPPAAWARSSARATAPSEMAAAATLPSAGLIAGATPPGVMADELLSLLLLVAAVVLLIAALAARRTLRPSLRCGANHAQPARPSRRRRSARLELGADLQLL